MEKSEVVFSCKDIDDSLDFYVGKLGFLLEEIFPADDPREALISKADVRIRLRRSTETNNISLKLDGVPKSGLVSPDGVKIEALAADRIFQTKYHRGEFELNKYGNNGDWIKGRAGMRYRDLIPGRQGGLVIASHIHVANDGPVADYVHYHDVGFQIIYCLRGSARLVYEDQGPGFLFEPGDCVLQPPGIRHRVLEAKGGLEVLEVSSPAEHITYKDNLMTLPTETVRREKVYGGQKFVRSRLDRADWQNGIRETGIDVASGGMGNVRVLRYDAVGPTKAVRQDSLNYLFVSMGTCELIGSTEEDQMLRENDSLVVTDSSQCSFSNPSEDLEIIEVELTYSGST